MKKKLQWEIEIEVNLPLEKVWDDIDDLTLITSYHPNVRTVEYISGQTKRAAGVSYKCIVPEGRKGWCIEQVVEHIPYEKTTVEFPEDSWGMNRKFSDFATELQVQVIESNRTLVQLRAFYIPKGFLMNLSNILFVRSMMRKRAMLTLIGFKKVVECQS